MDTLRGEHSTGLAAVSRHTDTVTTFKKAVPGHEFLQYKQTDALFTGVNRALIGHNRFATKGLINAANAHPFTHGKITGAHNGTLVRQNLLPDHAMFDVDSENIIYSFDTIGVNETVSKLHGAYALTWWDAADSTFNLLRNSERPLYYLITKDNKTILYASEGEMLQAVANRNNIQFEKIQLLPKDTWTQWNIPKGWKQGGNDLGPRKELHIEGYKPPLALPQTTTVIRTSAVGTLTNSKKRGKKNEGSTDRFGRTFPAGRAIQPFLAGLGYDLESEIDWILLDTDGSGRVLGVTLDANGMDVVMTVGTEEAAKKLLADYKDKFFMYTEGIRGYYSKTDAFPDGAIIVSSTDTITLEWNHYEGTMGISKDTEEEKEEEVDGNTLLLGKPPASSTNLTMTGYRGEALNSIEFKQAYKTCAWCSSPLIFGEGSTVIIDHHSAVCSDCARMESVQPYLKTR